MYHEDDAIRFVESAAELQFALQEHRIGYYVEDDSSEYGVMVTREDNDVIVRVVEDAPKHKVICELVFDVFYAGEVEQNELRLLWIALNRFYGGGWTFYDWRVCDNLVINDMTPQLTRMAWEAENGI